MMSGNDGYIELALKVMARMCDGQNHTLQVNMKFTLLLININKALYVNHSRFITLSY